MGQLTIHVLPGSTRCLYPPMSTKMKTFVRIPDKL